MLLPPSQWGFGLDTDAAIWCVRCRDAGVDGTQNNRQGFLEALLSSAREWR
jgi:hypothetical protein